MEETVARRRGRERPPRKKTTAFSTAVSGRNVVLRDELDDLVAAALGVLDLPSDG